MIWDKENLFSNSQALAPADSDAIVDSGSGDAGKGEPCFLGVTVSKGSSGDLTVVLNASENSGMAGAAAVASFTVPADRVARGGTVLRAVLPTGCKRYLRLAYSGASGGTVTAGLAWSVQAL